MFHLYTQRFCFVLERKEIIHLWLHRQHCNGDSNDEFKREVRPGGMWMTAVVRSSSHRRTSPTGRSRRSLMFRRTGSCQPISTPPRKPDTYTYALQETGHTHHTPTRHTHIHAGCRAQEVWQPQSATCPNAARCDDGGPPRPPRLFREPSHPQRRQGKEVLATEPGGPEGRNERVSADRDESFLTYRSQTRRSTTRGASGASDTTQTTATPGRSVRRLWEMTGLHGSTI